MERARQLAGEVLICLFLVILGTGVYLMIHFVPADAEIFYDGSYLPLQGVHMSEPYEYETALRGSLDIEGGLLSRRLHQSASIMFLACTVVWALLGRYREAAVVFALGLLIAFSGSRLAGGHGPESLWWGVHLVAALAVVVILLRGSWQEARINRRTPGLVALALAATAFLVIVL
ncbi:hypothetical protein [Herbidospora mongoliensis]|uniref:hypothetical protein n=1 Tax=Herbidospora mongoliensis TaxID=688067 RepID=UPI000835FD81|nr:hypothetical protein [Herbidospora mongoliensis]